MLRYIMAERLKWKRTFTPKLVFIAPIITVLMYIVLSGGRNIQMGAYNFWYVLLLTGMLSIICSAEVQRDAKMKFRAVLGLPLEPRKIWIAKILACAWLLLAASVIFFIAVTIAGQSFGHDIPHLNSVAGSILIYITFLWQIPLCNFLSAKFGVFVTILLNIAASTVGGILLADKGIWWALPYAIPIRLMCPVLKIMPNGLSVNEGSFLLDPGVILPGVLISFCWFLLLSSITALWFQRQEAK